MDEVVTAEEQGQIAAFFDLDKTIIAGACMLILSPHLRQNGLITRRSLVRAGYGAFIFELLGANEARMEKMRNVALKLTKGWNHDDVQEIVRDALDSAIVPKIYRDALEKIKWHKAQGHRVVIVSSSPVEIVEPIAEQINTILEGSGIDDVIATRAKLDADNNYTGELDLYVYGPYKPEEVTRYAKEHNIFLAISYAYSDSITDTPFLECVGKPVAVNPDRHLAKYAKEKGWDPPLNFKKQVTLRDRLPMDAISNPWVQAAAGVTVATITGLAVAKKFGRTK